MAAVTIQRLDATHADDYRAIRLAALQDTPEWFGSTDEAEVMRPICEHAEWLTHGTICRAYAAGRLGGTVAVPKIRIRNLRGRAQAPEQPRRPFG